MYTLTTTNNQNLEKPASTAQWISAFFCLAYCYLRLTTSLADGMMMHIIWLLWFVSLTIADGKRVGIILRGRKYLYLYVFAFYYFITSSFGTNNISVAFNRTFVLLQISSPILMYDYYRNSSRNIKSFFVMGISIITLFVLYSLITAIFQYGLGLRIFLAEGDVYLKNAYTWAYSWVLLTVASSLLFNKKVIIGNSKGKITRVVLLAIFLVGVWVVFRSLLMIALVCMVVGVALSFFYGSRRWLLKTGLSITIIMVLFMVFYSTIISLSSNDLDVKGKSVYRFEEINNVLSGNFASATDVNARSGLTLLSFNTFVEHPLFGINHQIKNIDSVKYIKIGDHSEWVDNLGLYGLFSILLIVFLIRTAKELPRIVRPVVLIYFLIGFLNPIWYFLPNLATFFFIPLAFNYLNEINALKLTE